MPNAFWACSVRLKLVKWRRGLLDAVHASMGSARTVSKVISDAAHWVLLPVLEANDE